VKSKVLVTIDTEVRNEGRHLPDAFERYVLGAGDPANRGSLWISEMLSRHGFPGVFFLDVYGSVEFPKANYSKLCEQLLSARHSVQLHTHPDRMFDRERLNMHEYSATEQVQIIEAGVNLLIKWTGVKPNVHRAGRYGANLATLEAISANGIKFDTSFFYGRDNCKLPFENTNHPFHRSGIWEIPVTVAPIPVQKRGFEFPQWTRRFWRRFQKLDVNCMDAAQLCRSFDEVYGTIPYVVLFLHSFSFTRRDGTVFHADQSAIDSFLAILNLLEQRNIEVITFDDVIRDLTAPEVFQASA
jgi:hypothetical protein